MGKERYKKTGADTNDRRSWLSSLSAVLIQSLGRMWLRWMRRWAAATKARWRELWGLPNWRLAMEWVAFRDANCRGAGVAVVAESGTSAVGSEFRAQTAFAAGQDWDGTERASARIRPNCIFFWIALGRSF